MKARKRRGISGLFGGTVFLVIMFLSFTLLVGAFVSDDQYQRNWQVKDQDERDKLAERLVVSIIRYDSNTMNLTLVNTGPVSVHVVRLWAMNFSASPIWHNAFNVNYYLNPGDMRTNIGTTLGTFFSSQSLAVKIITDRGNVITAQKFITNVVVGFSFGVGWLTIDWSYWYFTSTTQSSLAPAWMFILNQAGNVIHFQIKATNHWDRNVTLLKFTYLLFHPAKASSSPSAFYIMAPGSTPNLPAAYDPTSSPGVPIVIPMNSNGDLGAGGTPTVLKFYAGKAGTTNPPGNVSKDDDTVFLLVYYQYTLSGTTYTEGQTIAFEASSLQ